MGRPLGSPNKAKPKPKAGKRVLVPRKGKPRVSSEGKADKPALDLAKLYPDPMAELERMVRAWIKDFNLFVEEALGVNAANGLCMTKQQREAGDALTKLVWAKKRVNNPEQWGEASEEDRELAKKVGVSIMSGQGPGKDAFAAWVILWSVSIWLDSMIPVTAPTEKQIVNILWAEVGRWLNRMGPDGQPICTIKSWIVHQRDKIYHRDFGDKTNFSFYKTANPKDDPEAQAHTLYGFHAPFMIIILDEASGIPEPVFKPLEGTLTGECNLLLMIFNPIYRTGFAVESQVGSNSDKWVKIRWDAEESEIVSRDHIRYMEERYGRESNTFRTLVKGLPPLAEADALIPYDWVQDSVGREITPHEDDPRIGGLDCGAGGDNSVLCIRQGGMVEALLSHNSPDTMQLVSWAATKAEDLGLNVLAVDVIGIGQGVYDRLRELNLSCRVIPVDVRRKADNEDRYHKKRDELWFRLRDVFEKGLVSIPNDDDLKAELWGPKFQADSTRKIKVESKYDMRRRLGFSHSPNKADALGLTYYLPDRVFRGTRKESVYRRVKREERDMTVQQHGWMVA